MDTRTFYSGLFREAESQFGPLDESTTTSVIGFSAGGPVSISAIEVARFYATCELSLYPEQVRSTEGLRFELACIDSFSAEESREILTAVGNLSMGFELGNGHSVGLSGVFDGTVKLRLFSQIEHEGEKYGVYKIYPLRV